MTEKKVEGISELDWIQIRKETVQIESFQDKLTRKVRENPLVPFGCLVTTAALSYGLWSFRTGNREMSQKMMRMRIVGQGFTFIALITGVIMTMVPKDEDKNKKT